MSDDILFQKWLAISRKTVTSHPTDWELAKAHINQLRENLGFPAPLVEVTVKSFFGATIVSNFACRAAGKVAPQEAPSPVVARMVTEACIRWSDKRDAAGPGVPSNKKWVRMDGKPGMCEDVGRAVSEFLSEGAALGVIAETEEEGVLRHTLAIGGNVDPSWCATFDETIANDKSGNLKTAPLLEYARLAGPMFCMREINIYSELPTVFKMGDDGRFHCDDGPAIEYADGTRQYIIDGVIVPGKAVYAPDTITAEEIAEEKDMDRQEILIRQLGVSNYILRAGAKLLDTGMSPVRSEGGDENIMCALFEDKTGRRFFIGTDGSTERVYSMCCPPHVKTCAQAHEAISGADYADLFAQG